MSIQIIEGEFEHVTEYRLNFFVDPTGGFSFPCDENGNVTEEMSERAIENLKYCREHPEKFYRPAFIEKLERDYKNPNKGICHCGEEFELYDEYLGACECPNCGRWYNLWGQELLPPDRWGDVDYDY